MRVSVAHEGDKTSPSSAGVALTPVDDDEDLLNAILGSESPDGSGDDDSDKAAAHGDPPDPEELVKALQELETSASSDAVVREKIAKLPAAVSEVSQLENLKTPDEGRRLLQKVRRKEEKIFKKIPQMYSAQIVIYCLFPTNIT